MSCSPIELKDYFLKELPHPQALLVEEHVRKCPSCREELDRLRLAEAALFALRDEEIPQRIAFVSDQVFEPSPVRRWWAAFWNSAPRLGFASAALLSAALLYFGGRLHNSEMRAAAEPARVVQGTASSPNQDVQPLIDAAVAQAVRESEARQEQNTARLLADFERRVERTNQSAALAAAAWEWDRKHSNLTRKLAGNYGPPEEQRGDVR